FNAHIKTISTLSHDLAEKEDAGWERERRFGVKVFDVAIVLDDKVDWVRPGMFGEADVVASKKLTGPVVPLKFVKQNEGKFYISLDGVYKEVTGIRVGAEFMLDDESLLGRTVRRSGTFEEQKDDKGEAEKRLSASGELLPVRSTNIVVPEIGWWPWPKITWLVPEETVVKKGDVVAKLDPKEREKQVLDEENRVTEYKSSSDELEKRVEITRRNWEFQKKVAMNKLEASRISAKETLEIVSPIPVYRAEMNLKLAEIKLLDQKRKVEREESKASPTVSPAEFRRMKRDLLRAELKVEQARLNLDKAREGKSVIAKSRARLNLSDAEDNLETVKRKEIYENLSIVREFERSKERLAWAGRRLKHRQKQVENHTITSPEDGLICYNKVNNNGAVTKVAVGNTVGPRFGILSIPDLSEMELKVEIDEKYYSFITKGMEVEVHLPSLSDERFKGVTTGVDLLFENRAKKDSQIGLYSSHEPLGDVTFCVRIRLKQGDVPLKPGLVGQVYFPINK
ncbi:MAG: HlyD family efflux transporter periplasmic adaptor subunit, partial [Victivallales bacterium]|nr:HlyD family efflux transporter periplasmic adaptor subunit [Victivallales bacterium]